MHKWELGCISFQYEGNLTEVCTCKNPAVRILCPPDPLLCCSVLYTSPFYFISSFSYSKSTLITSYNDRVTGSTLGLQRWQLKTWFSPSSLWCGKRISDAPEVTLIAFWLRWIIQADVYLLNPLNKRALPEIVFLPMLFLTSVREKRTAFLKQ